MAIWIPLVRRVHFFQLSIGDLSEHRNMPVDEALKFLSQNFCEHLERQRDRDAADNEREVKFLLKLLIESRYISIREYDLLIQHLTSKRDQLVSI